MICAARKDVPEARPALWQQKTGKIFCKRRIYGHADILQAGRRLQAFWMENKRC